MKKFFKILFPTALIGMMFACEAELAPITIKPDPVFDKIRSLYGEYHIDLRRRRDRS